MSIVEILFYVFSACAGRRGGRRHHRAQSGALRRCSWCSRSSTAPCIWLLLEAEFLAIVLMLVYVGAVMVLFLFVVMMLDINVAQMREGFTRYAPLGILIAPSSSSRSAASCG